MSTASTPVVSGGRITPPSDQSVPNLPPPTALKAAEQGQNLSRSPQAAAASSDRLPVDFANLSIEDLRRYTELASRALREKNEAAIVKAILQGREAVMTLLSEKKVDPSADNNRLIKWASAHGFDDVVRLLLEDKRVDPAVNDDEPLREAAYGNHSAVMRLLLAQRGVNPTRHWRICEWACESGLDDVKLLMSHPNFDPSREGLNFKLTVWACKQGPEAVKALLSHPKFDPSIDDRLLNWSCLEGHADIVALLLANRKIDLTKSGEFIFQQVCRLGHTAVLQVLLPNSGGVPAAAKQKGFLLAVINGHHQAVRLMLQHPGINPAAEDNEAIQIVGNEVSDNIEVAQLLLADDRVNPAANNSRSLLHASMHGRASIVRALLKDGRADPTVDMCACLVWAHTRGHEAVVAALLADPRVNPYGHSDYVSWFHDPRRLRQIGVMTENLKLRLGPGNPTN